MEKRSMINQGTWWAILSGTAFVACTDYTNLGDPLQDESGGEGSGGSAGSSGAGGSSSGTGGSSSKAGTGGQGSSKGGSSSTAGGAGGGTDSAGGAAGRGGSVSAGIGGMAGGSGSLATGGSAGADPPMGGTAGTGGIPIGGAAGAGAVGGAGSAGEGGTAPYAPRSGSFKMLVYSRTTGYRHDQSIGTGKTMLEQIAAEQGFEATFTEENSEINAEGLAQYEIVFFMNSTGTVFNAAEKQAYEEWMTFKDGAFAGVHSATDTENGWEFYSEVTGQYHSLHDTCCTLANIEWDPAALDFVAVRSLPNPWPRREEWFRFDQAAAWSVKPGFKILSRVTNVNNTRPVSYIREWGNFRAFYTSLGHEGSTFEDADVKEHVTAGLMWAVRREHLLR